MPRTARLDVEIHGDGRDAERAAGRVGTAYRGLGRDVDRVDRAARGRGLGSLAGGLRGVAGGAALAVGPLAAAGAAAVKLAEAASDSAEATSAAQQVFGKAYGQIERAAGSAARTVGLSRTEYLGAAKDFAVMGAAAGKGGTDLAKFSTDLVGVAGDLASFHNTSVPEAIAAIGSGLRGEAEPLRRFGILMDDATLRAAALRLGLVKTTKEALTPQQKTLAAQELIMRGLGAAQGDFARTAGGVANQQRILTAQFKDQAATIGTQLLPVANRLLTWANGAVPQLTTVAAGLRDGVATAAGVASTQLGVLTGRTDAQTAASQASTAAAGILGRAMTNAGLSARNQASGQGILTSATNVAYQAVAGFTGFVRSAATPVLNGLRSATDSVRQALNRNPEVIGAVSRALSAASRVATVFAGHAAVLGKAAGQTLGFGFRTAGTYIGAMVDTLGWAIRTADAAADRITAAAGRIRDAFSAAGSAASAVGGWFTFSSGQGTLATAASGPARGLATAASSPSSSMTSWLTRPLASAPRGGNLTVLNVKFEGIVDAVSAVDQLRQLIREANRRDGLPA